MTNKKKPSDKTRRKFLGFFDPNADAGDTVEGILAAIDADEKPPVPPKKKRPEQEAD